MPITDKDLDIISSLHTAYLKMRGKFPALDREWETFVGDNSKLWPEVYRQGFKDGKKSMGNKWRRFLWTTYWIMMAINTCHLLETLR